MKYLITGGSGYIGSRLTDLLVQHEDNEVVNLDIRAAGRAQVAHPLRAHGHPRPRHRAR